MISKFFSYFIKISALIFFISTISIFYLIFHFSRQLPDYSQLAKYYPPLVTRIYSADGKLIEEYSREYRIFVPIDYMPKSLIEAFLAAEDKNFYEHEGIDYLGVIRAVFTNLSNIVNNKRLEGASTITQQVVKNFILTSERSFERKIKEAILSHMVSKKFTKDQILELYLNQIFLGKRSYGVAAASLHYFGKSVEELTLEESAFLAALPKAPSAYSPTRNYEKAKARRDYVLNRMYEEKYITDEALNESIKKPLTLKTIDKSNLVNAGYFADKVKSIIINQIGEEIFYTAGLNIFTTLDSNTQKIAEEALSRGIVNFDQSKGFRRKIAQIKIDDWLSNLNALKIPANLKNYKLAVILSVHDDHAVIGLKNGKFGKISIKGVKWAKTNLKSVKEILKIGYVVPVEKLENDYALRQIPDVNGAMMAIEPLTGKVIAYIGGYDYDLSKFDRVSQAQRQPGSAIKPFVYLAALENNIEPNTIYNDGPISIYQGPGMPMWQPRNYKGNFLGEMTLRSALEKSRNLVTVRIADQLGVDKIIEIIQRFGINNAPSAYISMVLGSLETTLEKMNTAYAIIANGGNYVMPHYIELIQDRNGKIIYKRDDRYCPNCEVDNFDNDIEYPYIEEKTQRRLTDEASNYQIISILEGVVRRGTAARISTLGPNIGGKTGTTNNSYDAWFFAITPTIASGCYIGYDSPRTLGSNSTGSSVSLPVIKDFLEKFYDKKKIPAFKRPKSVIPVNIDKNTGIPGSGPGSIIEYFKATDGSSIENFYPKRHFDSKDKNNDYNDSTRDFYEGIGELY